MAKEKKMGKKVVRQSWKPHPALQHLYRIWMVLFAVFKIALGALATVVIICGVCALVFAGTLGTYLQQDIIPMAGMDLESFNLDLNSFVYCVNSDGEIELLQRVHAENNREWVEYEYIPENLIHATIAIEDKRFYEHQGVDWITTIKACARMFFGDGSKGGSTITQQFIKNWTGENSVTVQRKVLEIFRAIEFEKRYDKEVVLEWYLNTIYMGQRRYGVKLAAEIYFGKELEQLTVAECASLISITNNPSLYNPYRTNLDNGGLSGAERNRVRMIDTLDEMKAQGWITEEEYTQAINQEIVFKWGIDPQDRITTCTNENCDYRGTVASYTLQNGVYFCPECKRATDVTADASQEVYSYFVDTVLEDVAEAMAERDGVEWNDETKKAYKQIIQSGGYHIYSTIDPDVQAAVDSIYMDLSQIPKPRGGQQMQSAMVVTNVATGDIVAMAGGVGTGKEHDGWNRATDSKLQTGSSIKPISIYAPGFEAGAITPATVVKDLPHDYNPGYGWPKNDNRKYSYARTVKSGIQSSVNAVAANTLEIIGTGYSFKFAKEQFGLSGLLEKYKAADGTVMSDEGFAPLAMGAQTIGVSVRDMACAFGTFANNGVYRKGRTFTKVYDSDGNLILDNTQVTREILSRKAVDYTNYCLELAVTSGTGGEAKISGQTVYGKTGTTASNKDRWFCGFTGHYVAAVWCGYDQPEVINISGNPSAQLFRKVMSKIHSGLPKVNLVDTRNMVSVTMCLDSGKLATSACTNDVRIGGDFGRTDSAMVYKEDAPKATCDKHVSVDFCTEGGGVATEFCKKFAAAGKATIVPKSLVKLTQKEVDAIAKAGGYGLDSEYLRDDYIYLITNDGKDGAFRGLKGDKNMNVTAPYVLCTTHTEAEWKAFEAGQGGSSNSGSNT